MQQAGNPSLRNRLTRIAREAAELPGLRLIAEPVYKKMFQRPIHTRNAYYGVYDTYENALAAVPPGLTSTYDSDAAGRMYRDRTRDLRSSEYPALYWLSRLMQEGARTLFDLGGHIGVSYYAMGRLIHYPPGLRWVVHDVPRVMEAGREWAIDNDPAGKLEFADRPEASAGFDILFSSGALQYLDYALPSLLHRTPDPPVHVLINMVPMHPERSYFTIQNFGVVTTPYRISSATQFVEAMQALGYDVVDKWETFERHVRIPFRPDCDIDRYYGFYFRLRSPANSARHKGQDEARQK
ncbi:MAG TPA: methyltransferase, TIGR04325 family [Lysobacter sp.]|nr:methyltransferase, TIGR04325 family [Lysobacter sp.]